jgi:hypothetical protein
MTRPLTIDHERSAAVELAALRAADMTVLPTARDLQRQHGLSPDQAAVALAWARKMKIYRVAFS